MFQEVSARANFPEMEKEVRRFWKEKDIFARSVRQREGKPFFVFYEGPPTANGRPGIHHVLARAMKDLFPRYKTMRGFQSERKGGWDTHGLPVEIEVEKQLKLNGKQDIERYGIEAFNKLCRQSVFDYIDDWAENTPIAPTTRRTSKRCGGSSSNYGTSSCFTKASRWSRTVPTT